LDADGLFSVGSRLAGALKRTAAHDGVRGHGLHRPSVRQIQETSVVAVSPIELASWRGQEKLDGVRDGLGVSLQSEMAGVKKRELYVGKVFRESQSALDSE
jgi:hypothetical protein